MISLNVLVIEDDDMNRQLMSRYLNKLGHKSILAVNGNHGIEELLKTDFNIIIMDLEMPIMNGYETAVKIRSLDDRIKKHIPILAFTAQAYPALQQKAIEAGVDDFVMKPIDFSELRQKLHMYAGIEENEAPSPSDNLAANLKKPTKAEIDNLEGLKGYYFEKISLGYLINSSYGDPTFVQRMISSFVSKTPQYLEDLQKLVEQKEFEELKTLAHKFKATIVITEVKSVAKIIEDLEKNIIEKTNLDQLPQMVNNICQESTIAVQEAEKALKILAAD